MFEHLSLKSCLYSTFMNVIRNWAEEKEHLLLSDLAVERDGVYTAFSKRPPDIPAQGRVPALLYGFQQADDGRFQPLAVLRQLYDSRHSSGEDMAHFTTAERSFDNRGIKRLPVRRGLVELGVEGRQNGSGAQSSGSGKWSG